MTFISAKKYTIDADLYINKTNSSNMTGETRVDSVVNGLKKAKEFALNDNVVMMFDTTHPCVDEKCTEDFIEAVKQYIGATLGQRRYDTCYRIDKNNMLQSLMPCQKIVSGALPESFKFKIIYDIYMNASNEELNKMTSAEAIALAHNLPMKICTLNTLN